MIWIEMMLCTAAMAITLACKVSQRIKYHVKFFIFMIASMICGTIFVPLMLHRPKDSRNGLLPSWGCRLAAKWLGVTYEIRGKENILPKGSGCVVVINHQSALDLVVMSYIWPLIPKGATVVKKEVLYLFPFGPATWLWGTVFIDRLNSAKAQKTINRVGNLITKKHTRICMFPEGTRNEGDILLPFKKGAFHVALAAQCPIQPVVVSKYHFLDHDNKRFDWGHNIIEFLPCIPTEGMDKENLTELTNTVRKQMQEAYSRISTESKIRTKL